MEMAECIIKNGRPELLKTYPLAVYEGENGDSANKSAYPMVFPEKLTVQLLENTSRFRRTQRRERSRKSAGRSVPAAAGQSIQNKR